MTDGIRFDPCPHCLGRYWIDDGLGDWIKCSVCNGAMKKNERNNRIGLRLVHSTDRPVVIRRDDSPPDLPPAA
jgi:hypothetical protein